MKVTLTRRWGPHQAGKSVDVNDSQGAWLIQHSYAESAGNVRAPEQPAAAEGAHGADPLMGGDATRLRPRTMASGRDHAEGVIPEAPGSSPTYRAGFTKADRANQGEVGREAAAPASDSPADDKRPIRRRKSSASS